MSFEAQREQWRKLDSRFNVAALDGILWTIGRFRPRRPDHADEMKSSLRLCRQLYSFFTGRAGLRSVIGERSSCTGAPTGPAPDRANL